MVAAVVTLFTFVLLDRRLAARDEYFAAGDEAAIEHVVDVVDLHLVAVRVRRRLVGAAAFLDIDDIDDDDVVTLIVLDLDVDIRAGAVVDDHDLGVVVLAIAGGVVGIHNQILLLSWTTEASLVLNEVRSAKLVR